jgi:hypothetical protein
VLEQAEHSGEVAGLLDASNAPRAVFLAAAVDTF